MNQLQEDYKKLLMVRQALLQNIESLIIQGVTTSEQKDEVQKLLIQAGEVGLALDRARFLARQDRSKYYPHQGTKECDRRKKKWGTKVT